MRQPAPSARAAVRPAHSEPTQGEPSRRQRLQAEARASSARADAHRTLLVTWMALALNPTYRFSEARHRSCAAAWAQHRATHLEHQP